jgi:hypothetical protein
MVVHAECASAFVSVHAAPTGTVAKSCTTSRVPTATRFLAFPVFIHVQFTIHTEKCPPLHSSKCPLKTYASQHPLISRARRRCRRRDGCKFNTFLTRLDCCSRNARDCREGLTRLHSTSLALASLQHCSMGILTRPGPSALVLNSQPPQSVYNVFILVRCLKVQFVSKAGCLRTLMVHVGSTDDTALAASKG